MNGAMKAPKPYMKWTICEKNSVRLKTGQNLEELKMLNKLCYYLHKRWILLAPDIDQPFERDSNQNPSRDRLINPKKCLSQFNLPHIHLGRIQIKIQVEIG